MHFSALLRFRYTFPRCASDKKRIIGIKIAIKVGKFALTGGQGSGRRKPENSCVTRLKWVAHISEKYE